MNAAKDQCFSFDAITAGYGDTHVIFDVSGQVTVGSVLGIFGRNGVGKTTLAKALQGGVNINAGSITYQDSDISTLPPNQRRRAGVGYMPQTGMVFDDLTVAENLAIAGGDGAECEELLVLFPRLAERRTQLAGTMSGGERKILGFVRTMLESTRVIILDEPTEGVQPENISKMEGCLRRRQEQGCGIILIEQNLTMLMNLADDFMGLDAGRVIFSRPAADSEREDLLKVLSV